MAKEFRLPDLGEGIHEGEIVDVLVKEGEDVKEDQSILEVETDKAAVELPSPFTGKVTRIYVKKGDLVHVGDLMISFDGEAEAQPEAKQEEEKPQPAQQEERPAAAPQARPQTELPAPAARGSGPVPAAPSTRRLARELGVDLHKVPGSGPAGRVLASDVRAFAESGGPATPPEPQAAAGLSQSQTEEGGRALEAPLFNSVLQAPELPDFSQWGAVEKEPLRSVRRATARQMSLSWAHIPHVNHHDQVDITALEETRKVYNSRLAEEEQAGRLTLTVFVLKALAAALRKYPRFNASLDEKAGEIVLKKYVHMGVAVDTPRGLIVPVIRDVDRKSMAELSLELAEAVQKAQAGETALEDLQGGTFTVTNPGPLGGLSFTPIINYPEAAILGMGRASWQPVVQGKGSDAPIVPRYVLPLVLAFDHRLNDGADAARFMSLIKKMLADPHEFLVNI